MPTPSLKIAHIDPETGFSGGEVQVFLLMRGLARRGHVNVLVCPPGSESATRAAELGIETHLVPMRFDLDVPAVLRLRRVLSAARPDLVHLHTGRANWLGGLAARSLGLPAVTTRRMDRPVKRNWRTRLLYGSLVARAAAISPAVLARLRAAGVPEERTELVWSSVRPADLEPVRGRERTRAELGVEDDRVVLLTVGALVPRKGLDVLLDALRRVARGVPHELWIAGEGSERDALEARAAGLPVRFLGRRADVPDLLAACDLFVMPSRAEGLGIAALEALSVGRAVVASDVGGLADVLVHGRTGRLVPPEDPAALAAAIDALLADPEERARCAAAGPKRVAEGFLDEQMVAAYEALYARVLGERAGVAYTATEVVPGRLSACVITKDEQDRLPACLASLAFCDEIVVVDSHSSDGTRAVAEAAGARVIERDWPGYGAQKAFAVGAASCDWVLCVDADERISDALRTAIDALRARGFEGHAAWRMPRLSQYLGRWIRHGTWYPDHQTRLFDRRRAQWDGARVHEKVQVNGSVGTLEGELLHLPYRRLADHLATIERYTTLMAEGLHERGKRASVWNLLVNPAARFLRIYVWKRGFLDGWRGLLMAFLAAHYVRLKYAKLLVLQDADEVQPREEEA